MLNLHVDAFDFNTNQGTLTSETSRLPCHLMCSPVVKLIGHVDMLHNAGGDEQSRHRATEDHVHKCEGYWERKSRESEHILVDHDHACTEDHP